MTIDGDAIVLRKLSPGCVFCGALEGLSSAAQWHSEIEPSSLWAGLFDLRENLLGRAAEDLRALAA